MKWRLMRLKMRLRKWLEVANADELMALRRQHWSLVRDVTAWQRQVDENLETIRETCQILGSTVRMMALRLAKADAQKLEAANGDASDPS